jgi:hypothetical protein
VQPAVTIRPPRGGPSSRAPGRAAHGAGFPGTTASRINTLRVRMSVVEVRDRELPRCSDRASASLSGTECETTSPLVCTSSASPSRRRCRTRVSESNADVAFTAPELGAPRSRPPGTLSPLVVREARPTAELVSPGARFRCPGWARLEGEHGSGPIRNPAARSSRAGSRGVRRSRARLRAWDRLRPERPSQSESLRWIGSWMVAHPAPPPLRRWSADRRIAAADRGPRCGAFEETACAPLRRDRQRRNQEGHRAPVPSCWTSARARPTLGVRPRAASPSCTEDRASNHDAEPRPGMSPVPHDALTAGAGLDRTRPGSGSRQWPSGARLADDGEWNAGGASLTRVVRSRTGMVLRSSRLRSASGTARSDLLEGGGGRGC